MHQHYLPHFGAYENTLIFLKKYFSKFYRTSRWNDGTQKYWQGRCSCSATNRITSKKLLVDYVQNRSRIEYSIEQSKMVIKIPSNKKYVIAMNYKGIIDNRIVLLAHGKN